MASKLALRTLGAIALPGALLTVAAPAASAVEIAPLSGANSEGVTKDVDTSKATDATDAASASESNGLLNGETFDF